MKHRTLESSGRRGVASVEAVIVLPIFVLLFVGVMYFGRLSLAKADSDAEARACAWLYSMNNCQEVPPGCEAPTAAFASSANDTDPLADTLREGQHALESSGVVAAIVRPMLGRVVNEIVGGSRVAHAGRAVVRPPLFGGDTKHVRGSFRLACNLAPETASGVADKVWALFRP
jgi:hypothetical protein